MWGFITRIVGRLRRHLLSLLLVAALIATGIAWHESPVRPRVSFTNAEDACFTPDGKTFVTYADGHVTLYDTATGSPRGAVRLDRKLYNPGHFANALSVSSDGKRLAVRTASLAFKVFDLETLAECGAYEVKDPFSFEPYLWYQFSPGGRFLMGVKRRGGRPGPERLVIKVWDAATGKPLDLPGGPEASWPCFSPDDSRILLTPQDERDETITLWDWHNQRTWKFRRNIYLRRTYPEHPAEAFDRILARLHWYSRRLPERFDLLDRQAEFSPDGRLLACVQEGSILLLDAASGKELGRLPFPPLPHPTYSFEVAIAFNPDGQTLAASFAVRGSYRLKFWDASSGQEIADTAHALPALNERTYALLFNRTGTALVVLADDHRMVWDTSVLPPREICSVTNATVTVPPRDRPIFLSDAKTERSFFSPGVMTKKMGHRFEGAISADGKYLAIPVRCFHEPSVFSEMMRFLLSTQKASRERPVKPRPARQRAVEPDDSGLSDGYRRGTDVKLLDLQKGVVVAELPESGRPYFSPDGLTLATDEEDGRGNVKLWDLPPRKELRLVSGSAAVTLTLAAIILWRRFGRTRPVAEPGTAEPPQPEGATP